MAYVQVGIFREVARAEAMRSHLGAIGPVEVAAVDDGGGQLYRVRIGPMPVADARSALAQVSAHGVQGGSVILE